MPIHKQKQNVKIVTFYNALHLPRAAPPSSRKLDISSMLFNSTQLYLIQGYICNIRAYLDKNKICKWKTQKTSLLPTFIQFHAYNNVREATLATLMWKGTSRQRSGKGAIRKRFPLQKPEVGKNQTNNQVPLPWKHFASRMSSYFPNR